MKLSSKEGTSTTRPVILNVQLQDVQVTKLPEYKTSSYRTSGPARSGWFKSGRFRLGRLEFRMDHAVAYWVKPGTLRVPSL
jgi:hypothetical protein